MYSMRLTILIISLFLFIIAGCGPTINVMYPDHIFRISSGSTVIDPNVADPNGTGIKHNGWFVSDRTMQKVMKAKVK